MILAPPTNKRRKLNEIPKEIFTNIIKYMKWTDLITLFDLLDMEILKSWWSAKTISIKTSEELEMLLKTPKKFIGNLAHSIDLSQYSVDDLELKFISEYFTSIKMINLSNQSNITSDGIKYLQIHQIERLSLRNSNIQDSFCSILASFSHLTHIDLSQTPITETGILCLFQSDNLIEKLKHLSISRCYSINIPLIIAALRERTINPKRMEYLDISYLDLLFSTHVETIFKDVVWSNLRTINIKGCQDIPLKSIRKIKEYIGGNVNVINNSRLEDHSFEGIRAYLMGLYSLQ